ncbi:uncharacterized protein LOC105188739 [Harpegnathos saltator]|uniref:MYND-type domain-containing protein n=1 Tax=Harpegnathos saltator TaxID=610380 RepID=E2C0V2_HARSA|nr:uncharacterized protein LOC105188739 [Harpegnathos saltator]EFN78388.1 hypothetical protein EAI_13657 [Harpegnathos saltator]
MLPRQVILPPLPPTANFNKSFNPNVCHVCKNVLPWKLISCQLCGMIFYCKEEHKQLHANEHNEICGALVKLKNQMDTFCRRDVTTTKERLDLKYEHIKFIQQEMHRRLQPYEKQMIFYEKSCLACRTNINLTDTCPSCLSANSCSDHALKDFPHDCENLKICMQINMMHVSHPEIFEYQRMLPRFSHIMESATFDNMVSLIQQLFYCDGNTPSWSLAHICYTDILSKPLTLFYGMRRANLFYNSHIKLFAVHIIVNDIEILRSLQTWEFLLHILGEYKILIVIMIGRNIPASQTGAVEVCEDCNKYLRELQYECWHMSYVEYTNSAFYRKSNVVVAFDAKFMQEISGRTILTLMDEKSPLLITTGELFEAEQNVRKIQQVLGSSLTPIIYERNRFASYQPHRNHDSRFVYFPNYHLIIYSSLVSANDPIQTSDFPPAE